MEPYDAVPGVLYVFSRAPLTNPRHAFARQISAPQSWPHEWIRLQRLGGVNSRHSSLSSATMRPTPWTSPAAKVPADRLAIRLDREQCNAAPAKTMLSEGTASLST